MRYVMFNDRDLCSTYRTEVIRLGWSCSTIHEHEDGRFSVATNCPWS